MENLQPHQQRVVEEKEQLDIKIKALQTFIEAEDEKDCIYENLSKFEKSSLNTQLFHMKQYSQVLKERIDRFSYNPRTYID